MRRWFRIAVPMGIAALLVAMLAIGFGSPSSEAAKPSVGSGPAGCNEGMNTSGTVAAGKTISYIATFCSDPTFNFAVYVTWARYDPSKDLALRVTDPNGTQFTVDNDPNAGEAFFAYAPLAEGNWVVEVINQGSRNVNYDVLMGFG